MASTVIQLPRPRSMRPANPGLGFFVRVGRNDHVELLHLIASGERDIFGFVIDAHNVERHKELITEARRHNFDVILDPKTQQMGFPGANSDGLATLAWGSQRHHNVSDFDGTEGRTRARQIVDVALENNFTQLIGPTHFLSSANDAWLRRDIAMMNETSNYIANTGGELGLIYSLALPMTLLREQAERRALIAALSDAPCDALWLKVENFGDTATGEKTAAYVEACRDFHERQIPLIGDHIGGLPGLGALALGAVGGMAHGVTMQQHFTAANWRRPRQGGGGGPSLRVYVPQLDVLMKREIASALFSLSPRVKARCGCRDMHCCPHGPKDMIARPARHAIYQRAREISRLSAVPESVRAKQYLDQNVRRVSDDVAGVAGVATSNADLKKLLEEKQRNVGRFRQMMALVVERTVAPSIALAPSKRSERAA